MTTGSITLLSLFYTYIGLYTTSFYSYDYEIEEHKDPSGILLIFMIVFWPVFAIIHFVKLLSTE